MPNLNFPSLLLDGAPARARCLPDLSRAMRHNSSSLSTDEKLLSVFRPIMPFFGSSSRHVGFGTLISKYPRSSRVSIASKESGYFSQATVSDKASSCNPTALNTPKLSHRRAIQERKEAEGQQSLYLEHYLQEFCQQLRSDLHLGPPHEAASSIQENKIKHYQSHLNETIAKKLNSYNTYFYSLREIEVISELFSLLSTLQMLQALSQDPSLPQFSCGLSFSKNSKKNSDKRIIKIIAEDLKKCEKLAKKNANKLFDDFQHCMTLAPRIEDIVDLILPKNCDTNTFYLLAAWLTAFSLSLKKGDFTDSKIFYNTLKRLKCAREMASEASKNPSDSNGSASYTNCSSKSQSSAYDSVYGSAEKVDNIDTDEYGKSPLAMSFFFKSVCSTTKPPIPNRTIVNPVLKRSVSI